MNDNHVKVALISLGCAKNLVDSEIMLGSLLRCGLELTTVPEDADVLLINTCSFIQAAQEESINTILQADCRRGNEEDEEGDYDDYEYDDYEYNEEEEEEGREKDQKTFVEPAGTSEPLQVPNVNEVNKNEEYDDYYYYDDDDDEYDEDEEAFVEANGANDPSGEDYEYSSYEDEKNGPIEDGDDDNYDSYSEEEEWEEAPAAATSQLPIRK